MTKKTNPLTIISLYQHIKSMFLYHDHGIGMAILLSVIVTLSVLSGMPLEEPTPVFVAGEIALKNVIADKEIVIEDAEATRLRYDQIRAMQPPVFDINKKNATQIRENILALLHTLNTTVAIKKKKNIQNILNLFNKKYNTDLDLETFQLLSDSKAQEYAFSTLLPWLDLYLLAGILPDMRLLSTTHNSIIIRDRESNSQSVRSIRNGLLDLRALIVMLGNKIRTDSILSASTQAALIKAFPKFIFATLALNKEASNAQIERILSTTAPVSYHINKGEMLVRKGKRVTRTEQLKMQTLFNSTSTSFNITKSLGAFCLGFTLMIGLYMTPSGAKGRVLKKKDQLFIAVILLLVGLTTVILFYYSYTLTGIEKNLLPFAFPIAGTTGLAVLIFSARRYCVFGLLLSFYATLLFNADLEIFLFYFLSSMISTWLILRTQTRQDVVWSAIPLTLWLFFIGFASAFLYDLPYNQCANLAVLLLINSILSILILFALSPVLEMFFGYTTRFKLMELISLDHPLLQELMMTVPGTYHHALVVSTLVESAAKAIGANSLLVKVGALYHDVGKIARPDYFAENQFNHVNPHDKLSPAMSCLVLFSHVKHGVELAQKHKLGPELTDIIQQHHGTRIPAAFFHKAVKLGENPKEADYCYPGPRPQSKEAAILMIADTVEAAIRSMGDPSPARIRTSVETLIKNIYAEGQLDETDLTFKDLHKLIDSFTRSLTGLYHQRIAYPDFKKNTDTKLEDKAIDDLSVKTSELEKDTEDTTKNVNLASQEAQDRSLEDTETTNMMFIKEIQGDPHTSPHQNNSKEIK